MIRTNLLALAAMALAIPTLAPAATITVPGDYSEIRKAVENASPGDTVLVESGTYTDRVRVELLDGLTIQGMDTGGGAPVLQTADSDDAIRVRDSANVTITGLRITGGERGVRIDDGTTDVEVIGNEIDGTEEGIRITGGSGHIIMGNTIANTTLGRGIRVDKASGVQIDTNLIDTAAREGIRAKVATGISLTGNTVVNSGRDGIRVDKSDDAVVGDGVLGGNVSSNNARSGIRIKKATGLVVGANTTDENSQYGIRIMRSTPIVAVADLTGASNLADCNGRADFRVDSEIEPGACGSSSTSTTSTSSTTTTSISTTTTSLSTTTTSLSTTTTTL